MGKIFDIGVGVSRLPSYTGLLGRIWHYLFLLICALVFLLLIGPLLVIIPLSFNADSYFTFSEGMLRLDPDAFSLKWYREIFGTYEAIRSSRPESYGSQWATAAGNSVFYSNMFYIHCNVTVHTGGYWPDI